MRIAPIIFLACFAVSFAQAQGPLAPPGPPAPTMRTLEQIEPRWPITNLPFTISLPGSYYVTRNLTGTSGQNGITIAANGVTLDLMGFELIGAGGALAGIHVSGTRNYIVIQNGIVRAWPGGGITAQTAVDSRYSNLRLIANGNVGLNVGTQSVVQDCLAANNVTSGIFSDPGSTVTLINNQAIRNGSAGIHAGQYSTVIGCVAYSNSLDGIMVSIGSTVRNCTSARNGQLGISASDGSVILQNTVVSNGNFGIYAVADCRIEQNHCAYNGAGGIRAASSKHVIKDNTLIRNGVGLRVDSFGSLITGNIAVSNSGTNYVIAIDNKVGPIVVTPNSAAIAGNTGGAGLGTTDPWANFSY